MMSLKCIVSTAYQRPPDGSRALPLRLRSWHAELYSKHFKSDPTGLSSGGRFGSPIRGDGCNLPQLACGVGGSRSECHIMRCRCGLTVVVLIRPIQVIATRMPDEG
jgi:hypothetical protein